MKVSPVRHNRTISPFKLVVSLSFAWIWLALGLDGKGEVAAQAVSPITTSGLNTQVSAPTALAGGELQHDITGGTRVGGNLFHSFGDFSVPTNNVANFLNGISFDLNGSTLPAGLPTSNILARVTGPNPSAIFGTVQTTGFNDANLFLMNPAGIVFGPNASLNVGGSVVFTTANHLRLGEADGANAGIFHASSSSANILTSAPVTAFGFLHSTAGISVQGANLSVEPNQSITVVGGNEGFEFANPDSGTTSTPVSGGVTLTAGTLSAPGGNISIGSIASSGEISASSLMPSSGMTMGNIRLVDASLLNASGEAGGSIKIRGGSFVIEESTLSANSLLASGRPIAIDINLDGNLTISNNTVPALTALAIGEGSAGGIQLIAKNISAQVATEDFTFALLDTHTSGAQRAGDVTIATENLTVGMADNGAFFIDSGTSAPGDGGNVAITATSLALQNANINSGDFRAIVSELPIDAITGSGGKIDISADRISLEATVLASQIFRGHGGDISLGGNDITLNGSSLLSTSGSFGSGAVSIKAQQFTMTEASQLEALTIFSPGGNVEINTGQLELSDGSTIRTQTGGLGPAGDIVVKARDNVKLSGEEASLRPSGFYSNSLVREDAGPTEVGGNAGSISITTPRLAITGGARVDTTTQTSGHGGNVTIKETNTITIAGQRIVPIPEDFFSVGSDTAGGIFTRTIGSEFCSGSCGNGGNISLTAAQAISVSDGATISASSTGPGHAGNISINAGQQLDVQNGSITTEARHASGGNIDIKAIDLIRVVNSPISSSVQGGPSTAGGNITIDPKTVILQNAQILAKAEQGNGGNITITTPVFLADPASFVDASSQFGLSGTVNIQSPTSNLSGTVKQLSTKPSETQALLQNRCAALAGGDQSTFILAGRDALPSEPGGWLSSPLVMGSGMGQGHEDLSRLTGKQMSEDKILSLRRLTPPGFLVRTFAIGPTGCHS
ncbi:MAG: filamentous hemagglutinin N-terminal domain-containing protein [Nitrospira sp.]|nr:filamentous hemagglutinin N-terminal domain-containing protein [Nitrospira sp.]